MTFTTTMSTIEDLSYTPSEHQKSRDLAQIKATGRRSWKTLKGKAEAVWGPELEAVLIEALEQYQYTEEHKPQASKHGVRFPYRNRFISQYIYDKTGKTRTHKQVGSRLQQLRDTCEDSRILILISRGSLEDPEDECKTEPDTSPLPPQRRQASESGRSESVAPGKHDIVMYTRVVAQFSTPSYNFPRLRFVHNDLDNPVALALCPYPSSIPGPSSNLSSFSNTVQLYSSWSLSQHTEFVIYDGERTVMQAKGSLRRVAQPSLVNASWIYECDIAGDAWAPICSAGDPNRITILQTLTPDSKSTSHGAGTSASSSVHPTSQKVSIVYHLEIDAPSNLPSHSAESSVMSGHGGAYPERPIIGEQYRSGSGLYPEASSPMPWSSGLSGHHNETQGHHRVVGNIPAQQHASTHPAYPSQSYPPRAASYQGANYVLSSQPMVRSHSEGSSGGHPDYDGIHHINTGYAEPRVAQQWNTVQQLSGGDRNLRAPPGADHTTDYSMRYSY